MRERTVNLRARANNNLTLRSPALQTQTRIDYFERATKGRPGDAAFQNNLGTTFASDKRNPASVAKAVAAIEEATRLRPQYGLAWANLAECYARTGRRELARVSIEKALILGERRVGVWAQAGVVYGILKEEERALVFCDEADTIEKDSVYTLFARAVTRACAGEVNATLVAVRALLAKAPEWREQVREDPCFDEFLSSPAFLALLNPGDPQAPAIPLPGGAAPAT